MHLYSLKKISLAITIWYSSTPYIGARKRHETILKSNFNKKPQLRLMSECVNSV